MVIPRVIPTLLWMTKVKKCAHCTLSSNSRIWTIARVYLILTIRVDPDSQCISCTPPDFLASKCFVLSRSTLKKFQSSIQNYLHLLVSNLLSQLLCNVQCARICHQKYSEKSWSTESSLTKPWRKVSKNTCSKTQFVSSEDSM